MLALFRRASLALFVLTAFACSSSVESGGAGGVGGSGGAETCPAPTPGQCLPGSCEGGLMRTGEAQCQGGQWVCVQVSCDGGTCDGSLFPFCDNGVLGSFCCPFGAPCAQPPPFCDLGDGKCGFGADCGGCDGSLIPTCDNGVISSFCCPAGAPCVAPTPFCDLGNGACVPECTLADGGAGP